MNIFFYILVTELCLITSFGIETNKRAKNITNGRRDWIIPQAQTQTAKGPGWWWWVQRKGGIVFDADQSTPPQDPGWKPEGTASQDLFPFKIDIKKAINPFEVLLSTGKPNGEDRQAPVVNALSLAQFGGGDQKLASDYFTPTTELDTVPWSNPDDNVNNDNDDSDEEEPREEQFGNLKETPQQDYVEMSNNIPKKGGYGQKGGQVAMVSAATNYPFKQSMSQDVQMYSAQKAVGWNQPQWQPSPFSISETPNVIEEDPTMNYKDVNAFQSKGFTTSPDPSPTDENNYRDQTWGSLKMNNPLVKFEGMVSIPDNITWSNIGKGLPQLKWMSSKLAGWNSALEKYMTQSPKMGYEQASPKIWNPQSQKSENWQMKKLPQGPQGNNKYPMLQTGNNAGKLTDEASKQSRQAVWNFPFGNWGGPPSPAPEIVEETPEQVRETNGPQIFQFPIPWSTTEKSQISLWGSPDNKERNAKSFQQNPLEVFEANSPIYEDEHSREETQEATEKGETLIVEWGTPDQLIQDVMSGVQSRVNNSNILIIKGKDNATVWRKEGGFFSDRQDSNLVQLNNLHVYQKRPANQKNVVKENQAMKYKLFRDNQSQDRPAVNLIDKIMPSQKPKNIKIDRNMNDIQSLLDEPLRQIQALIQKPLLKLENIENIPYGEMNYENRDTKPRFGIRSAPPMKSLQYRSGNRETCGVNGVGCSNLLRSASTQPKLTNVKPKSDKPKANLRAIFNEAIAKMKKHIEFVESIIKETKVNRKKVTARYRKRDERKTFRESEVEYDKY